MALATDDNLVKRVRVTMLAAAPLNSLASHSPWDVVVIGAGPAGAIAARQLGLQGKCVLLIDKARMPRDKVCGGCLGGTALKLLNDIGLGHIPATCEGVRLKTFELSCGGRKAAVSIGDRIAISRCAFDDALVREAVRAGVTMRDQTVGRLAPVANDSFRSIIVSDGRDEVTVRATVVVIATGLAQPPPGFVVQIAPGSPIGLGAVSQHAPVNVVRTCLHMAYGAHGYVGITEVERDQFDIAASIYPSALSQAHSPGRLIQQLLQESGSRISMDWEKLHWHGTTRLTRTTTPIGSHRCLLIGDAAAYVEPFTGEGIGWAMKSGVLAASLLSGNHERWDGSIPSHWERRFAETIGVRHKCCSTIGLLMRMKPLRRPVAWGLQHAPFLSRPVVRLLDRPFTR